MEEFKEELWNQEEQEIDKQVVWMPKSIILQNYNQWVEKFTQQTSEKMIASIWPD